MSKYTNIPVSKIYCRNPPNPYKNNKAIELPNPCPDLLYGVELEIENTEDFNTTAGLEAKEDGSLRNAGREYVTQPATYSVIAAVLKTFFEKNRQYIRPICYSERTSVHVHANVMDMTPMQIASIVAIYQVFERSLFNYVGADRDKSIFCVPLSECVLSYNAVSQLQTDYCIETWHGWQKYAALNLKPIETFGTIEFRHMPGTPDIDFILSFMRVIGHIWKCAKTRETQEVIDLLTSLNTSSQYDLAVEQIFGTDARLFQQQPSFKTDVENGVLNLKYSIINKGGGSSKKQVGYNFFDAGMDDMIPRQQAFIERLQRQAPQPEPAPLGFANGAQAAEVNWNQLRNQMLDAMQVRDEPVRFDDLDRE